MKKVVNLLLVVVLCVAFSVTAFATDGFVSSPGEEGTPCDHEKTELVDKVEPTCTKAGYTGDLVCAECGEVVEEGSEIPATGHLFENGVCCICGVPDVPKTGDNSQMMLWVSVMAVSAIAVVAVVFFSRKKAH